jgi:hypothetical protein
MCALALNGWRRIAGVSIAGLAAWLASAPSARADVTVKLNWIFVETRVSPRQEVVRIPFTVSYTLAGDKGVDATASSSGRSLRSTLGKTLGGTNEHGQPQTSLIKIIGGAFVVTTHQPGFFIVTRVKTDGHTACSATVKYFRNPGHQYFEWSNNSESFLASSFTAENMTCSISG